MGPATEAKPKFYHVDGSLPKRCVETAFNDIQAMPLRSDAAPRAGPASRLASVRDVLYDSLAWPELALRGVHGVGTT
jgi:hypothetical protein